MDYTEEWCQICGQDKGMCQHKGMTTSDIEQALRIRLIYAGIKPDKGIGSCLIGEKDLEK